MADLERPAEPDHYTEAFKAATGALRDADVRFALFGSTALWGLAGREPRTTEDIDLLVDPARIDEALAALEAAGFEVERPPEGWLAKAWHAGERGGPGILVDLIHHPKGIEASAALDAALSTPVEGMDVPAVHPTDLMASKAMTLDAASLDAQGAVEFARLLREQVDWDELDRRVSVSPYARALLYLLRELGIAPRT